MFINDINPVLLKLGFLEIRYYGIIYALGFVIACLFFRYYIKKGKLPELNTTLLDDLFLYLILGVVIGARLFYVIFYPPYLLFADPLKILFIWEGGLAFHGGLIGAIILIYIFCKKHNIKPLKIFDAIVIPASLALALGRIGNFTNQELYGPVTNLPWCVVFQGVEGCRHPYQLYAFLTHLILFVILLFIYKKQKKDGTTFWNFVLFYGIFRFITDFYKEEEKLFSLGIGQLLSIIMVIVALIVLNSWRKDKAQH